MLWNKSKWTTHLAAAAVLAASGAAVSAQDQAQPQPQAQRGAQQPGIQQPRAQQPGAQQPGFQRPGAQRPGVGEQDQTERLWDQIAQMHRLIVQIEAREARESDSERPEAQPGFQRPGAQRPGTQQPGAQQPAQQPGSRQPDAQQEGAQERDAQQPGSRQSRFQPQPGSTQPGASRPGATGADSQTDALWRQFAQVHQQIVKMKVEQQENGRQPTLRERDDQDRTSGAAQDRGQRQSATAGQDNQDDNADRQNPDRGGLTARLQTGRDSQASEDSEDSDEQLEQLHERLGEIFQQILDRDVAVATGQQRLLRPGTQQPGATERPGAFPRPGATERPGATLPGTQRPGEREDQ